MTQNTKYINLEGLDHNQIMVESNHTWPRSEGFMTFYYTDSLMATRTTLGTYKGGKWSYPSPAHMNILVQQAKKSPKIRRAITEGTKWIKNGDNVPYEMQWQCFRRKFSVKVTRLFNKIKHTI